MICFRTCASIRDSPTKFTLSSAYKMLSRVARASLFQRNAKSAFFASKLQFRVSTEIAVAIDRAFTSYVCVLQQFAKAASGEVSSFPGAKSEFTTALEFTKQQPPIKCFRRMDDKGRILEKDYTIKVWKFVLFSVFVCAYCCVYSIAKRR